jgi:hypothetical protein
MEKEAKSERKLRKEKEEAILIKRSEKEENIVNKEKSKFLTDIIDKAKKEFKNYEQGFRTFSVKCPKNQHFSIDDEILTTIIDGITNAYECDYRSLSLTDIIYPKSYTFTFYKPRKDISKNL